MIESDEGRLPFGRLHSLAEWMTETVHGDQPSNASALTICTANAVERSYSRHSNPTVAAFEAKFRRLEGGVTTVAMASGMAAASHTFLGLLKAGERIVAHEHIFFGVRTLLEDYLPAFGVKVAFIDMHDLKLLASTLREPTAAIYFETVSNPHLDVLDALAVIETGRRSGARVIVDNTLLTPCVFQPLAHGADLVIHSATKFIGGHGDALGGIVTTDSEDTGEQLRKARRIFGGVLSPTNAYHLERGLKTLPLRIERHCANAMQVARALEEHPRVQKAHYPGLTSSAEHRRAASFLRHFGAMISIELPVGADPERFTQSLRMCKLRYSFGEPGTVVLVQDWTPLIRISVGLERPEDIVDDLSAALNAV